MSALRRVAAAFFLAIANFFYRTDGFTLKDDLYVVWKCIPLSILILFASLHGGGLPTKKRVLLAFALMGGCAGDYLIGATHEGIMIGAIAFGIGHIFYLSMFVSDTTTISKPAAFMILAWNALIEYLCILPILKVSVFAAVVMTIYSLIFSATLIFAVSQYVHGTRTQPAKVVGLMWRMLGFALFYLSDSVLIVEHTGIKIPHVEIVVLSTYYFAQFLLVIAAVACEKKVLKTKTK